MAGDLSLGTHSVFVMSKIAVKYKEAPRGAEDLCDDTTGNGQSQIVWWYQP